MVNLKELLYLKNLLFQDYNNGWTEIAFYVHGNAYHDVDIQIALLADKNSTIYYDSVKVENVLEHKMHSEHYIVSEEAADIINKTKENGGRVICVGTTSCRTVESASENGRIKATSGETDIFIYPGYEFKMTDALITNFHLPKSTLVMLVSALAGKDNVLNAYNHAVEEKYRFFSFGDAMFIQ